jgi:2-polyprenyl-3-methyl-5-hydroxy-6-metoxy-1,4-benzoquinol methylase
VSGPGAERARRLAALRRRLGAESDAFLAAHGAEMESYKREIAAAVGEALGAFRRDVAALSGGNPLAEEVARQTSDYVDWLQWTLWDFPAYAVALRPEPERFRRTVAACGLVYLSIRLLDDLLDRHFWYRGRRHSLLATLTRSHGRGQRSEGLALLATMLLCFEGLARMSAELDDPALRLTLAQTVGATRRVLIGLIVEESEREAWTLEMYDRLVELKNVDYFRSLYAALDPEGVSPLFPFLERMAALDQRLNDLEDHPADESRAQPNLVAILQPRQGIPAGGLDPQDPAPGGGPDPRYLAAGGGGAAPGGPGDPSDLGDPVVAIVAADFEALAALAESLPPLERAVASFKLGERLAAAFSLGVFAADSAAPADGGDRADRADGGAAAAPPARPEPLGLSWFSTAAEVLERAGAAAIERVACPVCRGTGCRRLLEVGGFTLVRCLDCFHIYVNPRLRGEVQARIAAEWDEPHEDPFLEVQRLYAESLCRRLRRAAAGRRLLDVGFGKGYLLHAARAYGFEVYGVEGSPRLIERQHPYFGGRLARHWLDGEPLPWGSFDVVVLSHVLEHLPEPRAALLQVRQALNPRGLVYVAVPDMGSVQFRILGRRWNAIQPLVHLQYFNEASLARLLADAGFEVIERTEHQVIGERTAARWMRLFRQLGGTYSGELALLARLPPAATPDGPGATLAATLAVKAPATLGALAATEAPEGRAATDPQPTPQAPATPETAPR